MRKIQEIRRLKQVEETLRQNEEHYRLFFDSIPDGVVVVDTKGIIVECSRSATLLYKRLREELVGKHITEFLAPASVSTCKKDFSRVQQGETVDGEIQIVRGDGSIIDVWRKGVPLKDADGNIAGVLSYGRDITERKQAEDALRVLDARNRALVENIPDFILVVDRETTIYYANHVPPTIKREDMIGAKISDFIMPEYRDQHDEILRQVFQSREPVEFESINIFGQFIYARFVPVGDMVMIIGTDITERKQAEKELEESHTFLESVIENIPDAITLKDSEHRLTLVNQAYCNSAGVTKDEVIGKTVFWENDAAIFQTGAGLYTSERTYTDIEGKRHQVSVKKAPLADESGEITHVLTISRDITERKQAEDEVKKSRGFLAAVIENIPDPIYIKDRKFRFVEVNKAFLHRHKVAREEIIGKTRFRETDAEIFKTGRKLELPEQHYADAEGNQHWTHIKKVPLTDESGEITHVLTISRDITERKQAEEALRKSEEQFRAIFETAQDSIFIKDRTLNYIQVNPAMEKLFGLPASKLIELTDDDLFGEEAGAHIREVDSRVLGGKIIEEEHTKPVKGIPHTFHVSKVPMCDSSGEIIGLCGIARDITERKHAEELLRTAEKDWRNSFNSMDDVMLIIDRDYNIENINERGLELLGKSKEEVIGQKCYQVISGADSPGEDCPCRKSLETKKVESTDRYEERFGKFFSIKSSPILDENGEIIKFVDLRRDITERKRAEEQIKASLNEKEVLLKEIHHRVKNNMQVIISLLNLQSKHVKDKHDLEIFKDSQNRVKSMALIHEELYQSEDLARIDLAEYVQNVTSHLFNMYRVSPAAIKLVADIKDDPLDINTAIPCGLIINELVSNSLKYAFPNNREGEIQIKLYASKDDTFSLIVRDNGIGLPEDLDFRDTESLGLQLVVALVEQLKGTVELDRSEGTAFEIVFEKPK